MIEQDRNILAPLIEAHKPFWMVVAPGEASFAAKRYFESIDGVNSFCYLPQRSGFIWFHGAMVPGDALLYTKPQAACVPQRPAVAVKNPWGLKGFAEWKQYHGIAVGARCFSLVDGAPKEYEIRTRFERILYG